jgi:hypothetical protein
MSRRGRAVLAIPIIVAPLRCRAAAIIAAAQRAR